MVIQAIMYTKSCQVVITHSQINTIFCITNWGLSRNAVNCPSHPTVPWHHGITWDCPSYPTATWDFPQDVHLSLYRCMCPTVHPIPRSHGIVGHSTGCPPVPLQMHVSNCPSHPTVPWDIPRNVHLSLSLTHEYLTVHPIPRSHGSVK